MPHSMLPTNEDSISDILNWVCPGCGGRMGGRTQEFKCQGECRTDWRDVWERIRMRPRSDCFIRWSRRIRFALAEKKGITIGGFRWNT